MALSSSHLKYKEENEALRMENTYLRDSKLALIKATAQEMERLRGLISLLANALRGKGYTVRIQNIENISNKRRIKKKNEWKYKQKNNNNNNIKSNWYSHDSISPVSRKASLSKEGAPMSLKERMNALQNTVQKPNKVNEKMNALKAERNLSAVRVTTTSKDNIASLFAAKIEKDKKGSAAGNLSASKGKILKEALRCPEPEKAAEIVESLGLFVAKEKKPDFKKKNEENKEDEKEEMLLEVLNMNNNVMMKKMSEKEKENMENLICDSIIKNEDLKCVQMCNADINDAFLTKILNKLKENTDNHNVKELWFESNPIGDNGMKSLAMFIQNDNKIEIIKLYNNKKTISTTVLNQLLDAMKQNETIIKFVFDGFRFQHQKDQKEKYLRRNAEIARKKRNEERKRLKQLQNA